MNLELENNFCIFLQVSLNPVRILKNEAEEEKAEIARLSLFIGAIAIGDLVKSTLGPKGMDKILVSSGRSAGEVQVTNDGATILKSVGVDNPAAKILVDMSRVQDDEVGDGTTSVTVFGEGFYIEHFMYSICINIYQEVDIFININAQLFDFSIGTKIEDQLH